MRIRLLVVSSFFVGWLVSIFSFAASNCEPDGDVKFVCGPVSPEDLALIPETPWLIASGMEDDGYLYLIDTRDASSSELYPRLSANQMHDREIYTECVGPETSRFRPHGINLTRNSDGIHQLYVVRHGAREAIEVFDVNMGEVTPTLSWIGCIPAPDSVVFNSVVALPEGGIAATQFQLPEGVVWEWNSDQGWSKVPGSETAGPNGLEVSPDGRWYYIGGWGSRSLIRLSRNQIPVQVDSVDVTHHIDNVRWAPDGTLFAAGHVGPTPNSIFNCLGQGQCEGVSTRVTRVSPESMSADEIVNYPSTGWFLLGTVAIQVGEEIWVGGIAGADRIARFAVP